MGRTRRSGSRLMRIQVLILLGVLALAMPATVSAQRGGRGGGPPLSGRDGAAIDLTGYWVSVITEDWKYRMVTPKSGVFASIPLNRQGPQLGPSWGSAQGE